MSEVTPRALALGVAVGLVMAVANVYLGLFAGMTVSASIPAAVIGMGLLRGLFRTGTIGESNIVQTIASAGESLAAGIIFTMPALVIAGVWSGFDFWVTTLVAVTGGLLGVLFMIPLRRPLVVEDRGLVYPEGVACAEVLRAGDRGGQGMRTVLGALGLGTVVKLGTDALQVLTASLSWTLTLGSARALVGLAASPALMGVGYIVGLDIAVLVLAGGVVSSLLAMPVLSLAEPAADVERLRMSVRFLGVGAMAVGGVWSILALRRGIVSGVRAVTEGYATGEGTDRDIGRAPLLGLVAATLVLVVGLYRVVTGDLGVSLLATGLATICAFFFVAVAAYIVGLVGSSNSPVSGMTICSVLLTSAVVFVLGYRGETAILATLGVAGVVCCATCTAGDVCQDLKTGALVGATPARQQWAEILGVVTAAFVMQPVLRLLHEGYGIATDAHLPLAQQGQALEAPQAALFASLMQGFFGEATLPWGLIVAGALVGIAVIAVDRLVLAARGHRVRLHVMPVAVGMYLPFGLTAMVGFGGALAAAAAPRTRARGVLIASGLIAGEAIAGVLVAVPRAAEVPLPALLGPGALRTGLTLAVLGVVAVVLLGVAGRVPDDPSP